MEGADFSGYATKAGLKCTDGRTITAEAFKHQDKVTVPLVWQHGHNSPENVLGHAVLEARPDGVYAYGYFNETPSGVQTRALVIHKDIKNLSIWANALVEKSKTVLHGMIREVSLVLSGANPGALIDYVQIQHSDDPNDVTTSEDVAIIHTGIELEVSDDPEEFAHAEQTIRDVYDSFSDEQKSVVHYMIGVALEASKMDAQHSDGSKTDDKNNEGELAHQEGSEMTTTHNVFERGGETKVEKQTLSHSDMTEILDEAKKPGNTLRTAVESYAVKHGITDIDVLFPDAKTLQDRPEFNKRRTEWVAGVLNGTRHSPFSRVKSIVADLTQDAARAKGYIKGSYKKEEWFGVTKRTTTPTTIYKKQKLDRDDIVDIVDFDVVAWMKMEMRMMLDEEIARAILIGDGRAVDDEDKIRDPAAATDGAGIRSIANEHELYATTIRVNIDDANSTYQEVIETVLRARRWYKGSGTPTLYTTEAVIVEMLLTKDSNARRYYNTVQELASALMVANIVAVEPMEDEPDLVGIIVNLDDYNIGADRGGEINTFDDFDIDYNQYKYLMETRLSGALVKIKSALIIRKVVSTDVLVAPTVPTFVASTGVVTIPTKTGVVYKNEDTSATLSAGAQTALAAGASINVIAVPASGYYFSTNAEDQWTFTRDAA